VVAIAATNRSVQLSQPLSG